MLNRWRQTQCESPLLTHVDVVAATEGSAIETALRAADVLAEYPDDPVATSGLGFANAALDQLDKARVIEERFSVSESRINRLHKALAFLGLGKHKASWEPSEDPILLAYIAESLAVLAGSIITDDPDVY